MTNQNKRYQNYSTDKVIDEKIGRVKEAFQSNADAYLNAELYDSFIQNPESYYDELMTMNIPEQQNQTPQTGLTKYQVNGTVNNRSKGMRFYLGDVEYEIDGFNNPLIGYDYYTAKPVNGKGDSITIDKEYFDNATNGGAYSGFVERTGFGSYDKPAYYFGTEERYFPGMKNSMFLEGRKNKLFLYGQTPQQFESNNPNVVPAQKPGYRFWAEDKDGTKHHYEIVSSGVQNRDRGSNNYLDYWTPEGGYNTNNAYGNHYASKYGVGYEVKEIEDDAFGPQGFFSGGLNGRIVIPYDAYIIDPTTGKQVILNKSQQNQYQQNQYQPQYAPIENTYSTKYNTKDKVTETKTGSVNKTKYNNPQSKEEYDNWGIYNELYEKGGSTIDYSNYESSMKNQKDSNKNNMSYWNPNGAFVANWATKEYYRNQYDNGNGLYKVKPSEKYVNDRLNDAQKSYLTNAFKNNKFYTKSQLNDITNELSKFGNIVNYEELFPEPSKEGELLDPGKYLYNGKYINQGAWATADKIADFAQNIRKPQGSDYDFSNLSYGNRIGSVTPDMGDWQSAINNPQVQVIDYNNNMSYYNPINNIYPDGTIY